MRNAECGIGNNAECGMRNAESGNAECGIGNNAECGIGEFEKPADTPQQFALVPPDACPAAGYNNSF